MTLQDTGNLPTGKAIFLAKRDATITVFGLDNAQQGLVIVQQRLIDTIRRYYAMNKVFYLPNNVYY